MTDRLVGRAIASQGDPPPLTALSRIKRATRIRVWTLPSLHARYMPAGRGRRRTPLVDQPVHGGSPASGW